MSKRLVEALDHFTHGDIEMRRGEQKEMENGLADALAQAGLVGEPGTVKIKAAPLPANKMAPSLENKGNVQGSGEGQQSSSSPVAQVSTQTTANESDNGASAPTATPAPTPAPTPTPASVRTQDVRKAAQTVQPKGTGKPGRGR